MYVFLSNEIANQVEYVIRIRVAAPQEYVPADFR